MAVHSFKKVQLISAPIEKVWDFFSNPANLQSITPGKMGFRTISKYHGEKMYPGQLIEYTIKPLLGIPLYWMTEITHVQPMEYFVDEQRFGPYRFWHHQHHFKSIPGGVEMTDIIHYKNPLGFLGRIANAVFVKKELESIFEFRRQKAEEVFGRVERSVDNVKIG